MDCFFPHTLYVLYDVSLYLSICIFDSVSFISLVRRRAAQLHFYPFLLAFFCTLPPPALSPHSHGGEGGSGEVCPRGVQGGGLSEGGGCRG